MTVRQDKEAVPFKLLQGRDNLFERLHGLPKQSKEEAKKLKEKYSEGVDFREFLPNSVLRSPQNKLYSNSAKTQLLDLYPMDKKIGVLSQSPRYKAKTEGMNSIKTIDPIFAEVEEKLIKENQQSGFFNMVNFVGIETKSRSVMGMSPANILSPAKNSTAYVPTEVDTPSQMLENPSPMGFKSNSRFKATSST